jgi:hypothetical protein
MSRYLTLLLAGALVAVAPLAAQADQSGATLNARMQAFLREVLETPNTGLVSYFPRRGDWTWVETLLNEGGVASRLGVWRFPAAQTERAIGMGGPVCSSFDRRRGHSGPFEGRLGMQILLNEGPWRRVRGNRFVPPGASDRSTVFVEWRREDGEWVVSAFGDEGIVYTAEVVERPRGPFVADRTQAAEDTAFAPADWYTITINGLRHPRYGLPRAIGRDSLLRIGHLFGVNVYVERGREDGFLHLPVAPGQFQPYERWLPLPCESPHRVTDPPPPVHPITLRIEIRNSCPAVMRGAS